MKMKKVIPILMALFFVLPVANVFAANDYKAGLLDVVGFEIISGNERMFDNDLNTYHSTDAVVHIKLDQEVDITHFFARVGYLTGSQLLRYYTFIDKNGKIILSKQETALGYNQYFEVNAKNIKEIKFNGVPRNIYEFDIFGTVIPRAEYETILKLNEVHDYATVSLSWENPDVSDLKNIIIRRNGVVVETLNGDAETYKATGLLPNTKYDFSVVAQYSDNGMSLPVTISTTTNGAPNITDLRANTTHNASKITWLNPTVSDFVGVTILKNGEKVIDLDKSINNYTATNLLAETEYSYEVVARFAGGFQSNRVPITFTTLKAPIGAGSVSDLIANPKYDRVDLSWTLPGSSNFKHVNIYRDEIVQTTFIDSVLGVKVAHAAATKIFETNGTYFNDLTVKPETTYKYTLTTTSTESLESDGVTATVTTPEKPKPEFEGGFEKDPITGDFTYYWTEPSVGQVKINVGGTHYKTVSASTKKIIIPKNEMKYTLMGDPDVSMIVIDENGDESAPIKPPQNGEGSGDMLGNVKLPLSPQDVLSSGMGLLLVICPIILLVLAFLVVPKLRKILMQSIGKKEPDGKVSTRRFTADVNATEIKGQRERDIKEKVVAAPRIPREREFKEPRVRREKREREERTERAQRERVRRERATRERDGGTN